ncbi:MAG TPA: hypothetical protein VKM93_04015 [Terriglobia bacterium]|nr:hypothetical protein [Terriglobia bacterium]
MSTSLVLPLAVAGFWSQLTETAVTAHPFFVLTLEAVAVIALTLVAAGFLLLVLRISQAVDQFIVACRQRQKLEARIADVLREYVNDKRVLNEQLISAASALQPC